MPSTVASLLPNGEQQFCDANGVPYADGRVYFYIPNSSTLKNTWQDPEQNVLNLNPVELDAAGRAVIYGSGQYKQVLFDALGNEIWDQLTSSNLEGSGTFWAGAATGGGNTYNITIDSAATAYYAGMQIAFISDFTNTGAAQINVTNVNGIVIGPVNIFKQTSSGSTAMTGGEMPINNVIVAEFDGTRFQMINPATYSEPAGIIKIFAGPESILPEGYLICDGAAVNRTTYASLFTAIATRYGSGDGSTTFNIPDLRGRVPAGVDNMGGVAANRLTSTTMSPDGNTLNASGGSQLLQAHTHTLTDPGHVHAYTTVGSSGAAGGAPNLQSGTAGANTASATTGITAASTGGGAGQNVQPTLLINYIIKT